MTDQIFEQVRKIAAELFDMPASRVTADLSPAGTEAWDSVQHLNLMLELEQKFGVTLEPEEMEHMQSIGSIVEVIERKQRA